MMFRRTQASIVCLALVVLLPSWAAAADWQWPSQLQVGGFSVTGISGSVRPDGSGSATGTLQIPGAGGQRISLSRSSGGEITGDTSVNVNLGGTQVQAELKLNSSGLRGRGTIRTRPRPIEDASISVSTSGQFSGSGRLNLGRASLTVSYSISRSLDVSGSTSVRDDKDTQLAAYRFEGRLRVEGDSGRIGGVASGTVQRTGKIANQITNHPVSNASVDMSDGSCTVSVGGVSVTFRFF